MSEDRTKNIMRPFYPKTRLGAIIISILFVLPIVFLCVFSFADGDRAVSKDENRALKQKPKFDEASLFSGKLTGDFDSYYTDQFPLREFFLSVNMKTKKLLTQYGGKNGIVLVEGAHSDDFRGEDAKDEQQKQ